MSENQNNIKTTEVKKNGFVDFVERNSDLFTIAGLVGSCVLVFGATIWANERSSKRAADVSNKYIDATLEAAKYEADKKAEVELAKTGDIRAIVHDITTMKENH